MATATRDRLAVLAELKPVDAVPLDLPDEPALQAIILVREGAQLRAFENSCPHKGTTLDNPLGAVLDAAHAHLVCATHGARFRLADGVCISGPCLGQALKPVALRLHDGIVTLDSEPARDPGPKTTPPKV